MKKNYLIVKTKYGVDSKAKEIVILGLISSEMYPSTIVNDPESTYYGCDIVEVKEKCHIKLL